MGRETRKIVPAGRISAGRRHRQLNNLSITLSELDRSTIFELVLTCPDQPISIHLLCRASGRALAECALVKMKHVSVSHGQTDQRPGCSVIVRQAIVIISQAIFMVDLRMRQPL